MWMPDLADASWLRRALVENADVLALNGSIDRVELLDVRLTHPHRPGSALCRGWATCLAESRDLPPVRLYLKGYPDAGTADKAWADDHAERADARSVRLSRHDLVAWTFPDDPRLPTLPELLAPAQLLPAAARELLGPSDDLRVEVVRYQPEVSVTLRVEPATGTGPTVYAKHVDDHSVGQLAERHEALWRRACREPALRVAEPLGVDDDRGVLWTRGVPGGPLTASVRPELLAEAAARVGPLLATLHTSQVDAPPLTVGELVAELEKKAGKLTVAYPPIGDTMTALVSATRQRRDEVAGRLATLHGDFHLDQLVASADGPVLVDLDSMVRGVPEVDLAEFLVDLAFRDLPEQVIRDVAATMLSSYVAHAPWRVDEAALSVCANAEFVNRCYRHLRRHAPGWQDDLSTALAGHSAMAPLLRP